MKIRRALAADVSSVLAIEQASPDAAHWSAEKYEEIFASASGIRRMLVAYDGSTIQGFAVVRTLGDEWEIENIAVSTEAKRQGLGSQLLSNLLEQARFAKAKAILLEVRESNRVARRFYERFLFQVCSVRLDYYREPVESAIIYRIYL